MTATTVLLPPPTALDLAVVRARLELRGRQVPGLPRRWWAPFTGGPGVLLAAAALLVLVAMAVGLPLSPPPVALSATVAALLWTAQVTQVRRLRAGDRLINQVWAARADGPHSAGAPPETGAPGRAGARVAVNLALVAVALGIHVVTGVLLVLDRPSTTTFLALAVPVSATTVFAVAGAAVLRRPTVGEGPVLRAVDAYLRTADLSVVQPVFLLLPSASVLVAAGADFIWWMPLSYVLALVGQFVLVCAIADERLVRDPRLSEAPPAERWLEGTAA